MKRRLLPPCTALVLCLLLAPAAWAAVYPYPPIETLHIGSHAGTEIQKDTYYLVRGETVTTQGANADNYNIYYKDGTLTLRAAALPDYLLVPGETTIHLVGENTIGTKDAPTDVGIQGVTPGAHHHHWPRLLLHSQQRRRHRHGTARQRHRPPSDQVTSASRAAP